MSYGKMNTFIDIVEKVTMKDVEGLEQKSTISSPLSKRIGKVGTATRNGRIALSSPKPPTCSVFAVFPASPLRLQW